MLSTEATPLKRNTTEGGKERRTRRRLRVSCVECTKRRQKCDRQTPCSLCVSRGVSHLCRWETAPMARPAPARPPIPGVVAHPSPTDSSEYSSISSQTVEELSARIVALEKTIAAQNTLIQRSHLQQLQPNSLPSDDHIETIDPSEEVDNDKNVSAPIGRDVQEAAMALAQLSLGNHHGEYFGRGTVVCALHELAHTKEIQISYAMSTNPTCASYSHSTTPSDSFSSSVRALILGLPPQVRTRVLLDAFFQDVNWRFGIPPDWFNNACEEMWRALSRPDATGMEINVHWLCLFYSVLALAPQEVDTSPFTRNYSESETYFMRSLAARRLAKDVYFTTPTFSPLHSAADGTVLGCLATPLLCAYLAEMGRVSEAWKLLGGSIRAAQAVGMHRDPSSQLWKVMSYDEKILRTTGWWALIVWDRLYSFVLGRPTMIRKENYDVLAPTAFHPNFPTWQVVYCAYQAELVKLSDIVSDAVEKCLGIETSTFEDVFEVDRKFEEWEEQLPEKFKWRQWYELNVALGHSLSPPNTIADIRRCYILNTWYLACRMNLHRSYLTQITMPSSNTPEKSKPKLAELKKSHEQCIALAIDILRLQCITHDSAYRGASRKENAAWTGNNWCFELCYYLFDAGVTLMSGFAKMPVEARAAESQELVARSIAILESMSQEISQSQFSNGGGKAREIASRAVEVLNMLGRELGWRREPENSERIAAGTSKLSSHFIAQMHGQQSWQSSPPTLSGMSTYGFVPHAPLPVPQDAATSTPLSIFFSSPYNDSLGSFGQAADVTQPPLWSDLQNHIGPSDFW